MCAYRRSRDETIEGTVFTHDNTAGVVVIEQKGAGDKSTYRMLRSSAVKELKVLAPPADHRQWAGAGEAELPVVDLDAVHARYERAVAKVEIAVERPRRARRRPTPLSAIATTRRRTIRSARRAAVLLDTAHTQDELAQAFPRMAIYTHPSL